mgnify:CR=1 FL=1
MVFWLLKVEFWDPKVISLQAIRTHTRQKVGLFRRFDTIRDNKHLKLICDSHERLG